jgi:hypothetical protein
MNEKITYVLCIALCWIIALVVFFLCRSGRRTGADNKRVEELERRAADDNTALSESERRTREAIEAARDANRESDRIISEQTEDYRRAGANNKRASELLERAEKIVNKNNNK